MSTDELSDSDDTVSLSDLLDPGQVARINGKLYAAYETDSGTHVGILGDRRLPYDPDGNDCPHPACDGFVVADEIDHRRCSEGCLEWLLTGHLDGQDCWACEHGTLVEQSNMNTEGSYDVRCASCGVQGAGRHQWREAKLFGFPDES